MMEFFKALCTAAALLSLALLFVPEKKGLRDASFTAFSLLLLLLLFPKDGSFELSSLITFEENEMPPPAEGVYEETLKTAVTDGIRRDIVDRFSLDPSAVTLTSDLTLTETGLSGSYLSLTLGRENFFADVTALLRYLENTYGVDCEVHFLGA